MRATKRHRPWLVRSSARVPAIGAAIIISCKTLLMQRFCARMPVPFAAGYGLIGQGGALLIPAKAC
jgi:hypothetical protein